mgnify:CR=1 FL=1
MNNHLQHINSTHDVTINHATKTVTKTTTPNNPNYRNFTIEQAVWRELGGAQFPNDHTIVMDYFGPAGTFDAAHIPLIKTALDDLNDAVANKAADISLIPLANANRDAIVATRCGGTIFEDIYLAAREMVVDLPTVTVTHSDLRPDNYAVDEHGKLHLFDFESAELAPHTAAWSALLIDLWLNEHPQAGDVIDTELWSPECLTFKAALTTTHKAWKNGPEAAHAHLHSLDVLAQRCGIPPISALAN